MTALQDVNHAVHTALFDILIQKNGWLSFLFCKFYAARQHYLLYNSIYFDATASSL